MNVSKTVEEALKSCIMDGGASGPIAAVDCRFELFQGTDDEHPVEFPCIAITAAPDVPDGQEDEHISALRRVPCTVIIVTAEPEDRTRAMLVSLYERVRSAIDDATKDLGQFSTDHLPAGWFANCVIVNDSSEPYFDGELQMFALSVQVEVCVA